MTSNKRGLWWSFYEEVHMSFTLFSIEFYLLSMNVLVNDSSTIKITKRSHSHAILFRMIKSTCPLFVCMSIQTCHPCSTFI